MSDEALRALEKKWRDESNLRQESADKMENDDPQYASWHFGISDGLEKCADELAAILSARQEVAPVAGLERIEGMEFWLHENVDDGDSEPVRLVMAMSHNNKVFCHRASQGDNGICNYTSPAHTSEARDAEGEAAISGMLADGWEWNGQSWCREPSCEIGDADRYAWLKSKLLWADLEPDDYVGLTFALPAGSHVSTNLDATLDAAMRQEAE